jgi:cysteine desulfurase
VECPLSLGAKVCGMWVLFLACWDVAVLLLVYTCLFRNTVKARDDQTQGNLISLGTFLCQILHKCDVETRILASSGLDFLICACLFAGKEEMIMAIYLDYNATTPHDPAVIEVMRPFLETHFGNPSSAHAFGQVTHRAVEAARKQVADLLNCLPDEVIFTSGGTEANNFAIKGLAFARSDLGNHIVTTQVEHPAVTEVCAWLETQGFEVTYLPVDETGRVDVGDLEAALLPETILISVMHANNEVGTLQPIEDIATLASRHDIAFHTDAAQSIGKLGVDVQALGVDLLSMAGHKVYAPKGVGALFVREGVELEKFMHGAGHEKGWRAGTENVLQVVGLGKACEIISRDLETHAEHLIGLRDRLENALLSGVSDVRTNGHLEHRLPNTLSVSFLDVDADDVLAEMSDDVAASAGAACHSGEVNVSHVLTAMKVPMEWARGTLRLSVGRFTTCEEIDRAGDVIVKAVKKLRVKGRAENAEREA